MKTSKTRRSPARRMMTILEMRQKALHATFCGDYAEAARIYDLMAWACVSPSAQTHWKADAEEMHRLARMMGQEKRPTPTIEI